MTAADYIALGDQAREETLHVQGQTEQVILRGIVTAAETFGLPECDSHLIAKLRNMPAEQLADIRATQDDKAKEPSTWLSTNTAANTQT